MCVDIIRSTLGVVYVMAVSYNYLLTRPNSSELVRPIRYTKCKSGLGNFTAGNSEGSCVYVLGRKSWLVDGYAETSAGKKSRDNMRWQARGKHGHWWCSWKQISDLWGLSFGMGTFSWNLKCGTTSNQWGVYVRVTYWPKMRTNWTKGETRHYQ